MSKVKVTITVGDSFTTYQVDELTANTVGAICSKYPKKEGSLADQEVPQKVEKPAEKPAEEPLKETPKPKRSLLK